jgi:porin
MKLLHSVLAIAPFLFSFMFVANAHAYDIVNSPQLTGDWGGVRTNLGNKGFTLDVGYVGEMAHNFDGGTQSITRYTDQWMFGGGIDFEKMGLIKGGHFQVTITDRSGQNLGAEAGIGNDMLIQEVYGRGQTWHLTQLWYEQIFGDGRLAWKIGRLTVGEDFASFECNFQNLTFCGAQPGNLVGDYWVNWPTSVWATRLRYKINQEMFTQIGVYQVDPSYVDDNYAKRKGLRIDFPPGTTGAMIPLEFGWTPKVNGLPGSYKVGVWYNTAVANDVYQDQNGDPRGETGLPPMQHHDQYGIYGTFQQQITGTETDPGVFVFLNITQTDLDTAVLDRQISLGSEYQGVFGRRHDAIGLAVGTTDNNARVANYVAQNNARTGSNQIAGGGSEVASELFYSYSPIASLFLRPNLQYIVTPGGASENPNAFVAGLKSGVAF